MIDTILNRLDAEKQTGEGRFIARCPAHEDRNPSLSIRNAGELLLIHCFAGCDTIDVLHPVGLELCDLFANRPEHRRAPSRSRIPARDALATLDHESLVVAIIGADFLEQKEIDEPTWDRLGQAVNRINSTRARCAPART